MSEQNGNPAEDSADEDVVGMWLVEVVWVGERRQYLVAGEDEVDVIDSLGMIPGVKGAMDLGVIGMLKPGPVQVWSSDDGPPPEFPLTGPPKPVNGRGSF